MPIDPSIALRSVSQIDSPFESFGKAASLKSLLGQQRLQEMQIQQAQRQQEEERALNDAYRTNVGPGGALNRGALLSSLASGGMGSRIPALQKQFAEADKAGLDVKNTQGQIDERTYNLVKKRTEATNGMFSALLQKPDVTHQDVIAGLSGLVNQGLVTPEEGLKAVQSLPSNPQALRSFLMQKGLESLDAAKRLDMMTPQFKTIDAGNRILQGTVDPMTGQFSQAQGAPIVKAPEGFTVGLNGQLAVDPGYLKAKSQIAQAGSTKLSINTAKPLLDTMAEGLGKQLDAGLSGAQSAVQTVQNAQTLRKLLDSGNLITGPGADARVIMAQIGSALGVGGGNDAEKLANTRLAMQAMAKSELDAAQSMKGQGAMSDAERALVKRAAGGDISMSAPELKALAAGLEKNARARIGQHQQNVERLKAIPQAEGLIPFYTINSPAEMPTAAPTGVPPDIEAILRKHGAK